MASSKYDPANIASQKLAALGITNIEVAALYAKVSPTTLRRMLSGAPGMAKKIEEFCEVLDELKDLAAACWPFPLDLRRAREIQFLQSRLKYGATTISNFGSRDSATGAGAAVLEGAATALSGPKPVAEPPTKQTEVSSVRI